MITLSIDTASDISGAALHDESGLLAEATWRGHQSHSRDLLPTIDWLLTRKGHSKEDIGAIAVCLGPGSYAGLRVGLSTAKTLAFALDVPLVGVGRLAADALDVCLASGSRTIPLQAAGRAELAWAAYEPGDGLLREVEPPQLAPRDELLVLVRSGDVVCGDEAALKDDLKSAIEAKGARVCQPSLARVLSIARLGMVRLQRGEVDNADSLVPLYLRAPAIGPQPPR